MKTDIHETTPARRSFFATSAAASAFGLSLVAASSPAPAAAANTANTIRPFHIDVPEEALIVSRDDPALPIRPSCKNKMYQ